jgi:glycosyltransferase involved in cell wall biosynthesis
MLEDVGATTHVFDPLVLRRSDLRGRRILTTPVRWAHASIRLHAFSRSHRFDLVHSNCATTIGGAYLARRWRVPHVWHVHELFEGASGRLFERLLRRADLIVAASAAVAQQLPRRCVVAWTGADVPAGIPTSTPLTRTPPVLICVGRLNAWKGQDDLLRAAALLRDRGVRVEVEIVGEVFAREHQFRERLVALTRELGLEDRVRLLGERRDALELVARADIAVVPSAAPEPFGMVVVEAMALGRPVVATDAGGPREIVTHGVDGLLVPPRDPTALAAAIEQRVADPQAARALGAAAHVTARRFTSSALATRVLETHRELLAAR